VVKLLIGNKIDKDKREIPTEDGQRFAKDHNLMFKELSAKDNIGIDSAFEELINKVLDDEELRQVTATRKQENVSLKNEPNTPQTSNLCYC